MNPCPQNLVVTLARIAEKPSISKLNILAIARIEDSTTNNNADWGDGGCLSGRTATDQAV